MAAPLAPPPARTAPLPPEPARGGGPRWVPWAGRLGGPAVAALLLWVPSALHAVPGHGSRPAAAAAVAAWMALWWFTEAVPMALTALLPLALYPLLGVFGPGVGTNLAGAALPFLDPYIFLFLGGMALGAGLEAWGLHRRVALHILRALGTAPARLLLGVLVATAAVSLWISNTATAVMMLPIAMALLAQLEAQAGRRLVHFGTALMLAVAYAANVGGIGTKIGTPGNSVFAGVAARRLGAEVSFLEFLAAGLPLVVLLTPVLWALLWREGRKDRLAAAGSDVVARELATLGPPSAGERAVGSVFLGAAALWILADPLRARLAPWVADVAGGFKLQGKHYEAGVAMAAALVLLALGRLPWAALRRVPWDTLVLLGGGFALAAGIEQSGLSAFLTAQLGGLGRLPTLAQHALVAGATVLLSAIASNTATVNVMLGVLPPQLPLLATSAFAASCDFALPAGTPPNAIVFGSGRVRLPVMMRLGAALDVLAVALLALYGVTVVRWLWG